MKATKQQDSLLLEETAVPCFLLVQWRHGTNAYLAKICFDYIKFLVCLL